MELDYHDLKINGAPALFRALEQIQAAVNALAAAQTQQQADITDLQYLWSEEIMAGILRPAKLPADAWEQCCVTVDGV